jgi:hypothetical protein
MENNAEDLGKIVNAKSLEELAVSIRELAATPTLQVRSCQRFPCTTRSRPPFDLVWCGGRNSLPGVVIQMEILPEATVGSIGDLVALVPPLVDAYHAAAETSLAGWALLDGVPTYGEAAPGPAARRTASY